MGGASTEISASTTSVLLEMAWWQPMAIARTSSRLNLRSEASARFERGADPEVADLAADRFCELLAAIAARRRSAGTVDVRGDLPDRTPVRVRTARVNADPRHRRSTPTPSARCCTPIGFEVDAAAATATTSTSSSPRSATTPPPRSTSSRRSPATTGTPASPCGAQSAGRVG